MAKRFKEAKITKLQVEIAKLKVQGKSYETIADELGVNVGTISRALPALRKSYPLMLEFIREIQKCKYFSSSYRWRADPNLAEGARDAAHQKWDQMAREGYWPSSAPFGYRKHKRNLLPHKKEAGLVKQIFEAVRGGKSIPELIEDTRLSGAVIRNMLKRRLYCGEFKWHRKICQGKHEALVSKDLWKSVQPSKDSLYPRSRRPPFPYKWYVGHLIKDPEKAKKVVEGVDLRLQRASFTEIGKRLEIDEGTVKNVLAAPYIAGMIMKDGKLVNGDWEPVINKKTWFDLQRIQTLSNKGKALIEKKKKQSLEIKNRILASLDKPRRMNEVIRMTGLPRPTVQKHLKRMKGDIVEKGQGHYGKYFIRDEFRNLIQKPHIAKL